MARSNAKTDRPSAEPWVPDTRSLRVLAEAAAGCQGCPLYEPATQTVFGSGPRDARLILVGEQPGDVEDRKGRPFVGPAGAVLWECVEEAGLDRGSLYVTNAVKHFKHELRGKRRIHQKPDTGEIEACHPWIEAELRALLARGGEPVVVALGAVAARSLLGRTVPIAASRGTRFEVAERPTLVTYHPSAVLRADERAAKIRSALVTDLRAAGELVTGIG